MNEKDNTKPTMCVDKYIYSDITIYMHTSMLRIRNLSAALILQMSLP